MKRSMLSRLIRIALLFSLASAVAPSLSAQEAALTNIRVEQQYSIVRITYDLLASDDGYDVQLRLRKSGDPSYAYEPRHVKGDIGENVAPGRNKVIEWDVTEEFPDGLEASEGYRLNFRALSPVGFFRKYSWYLGGGAAAAGAALYFILSGGEEAFSSLPDPSGRPEKW